MGTEPPPFVKFRSASVSTTPVDDRVPVYRLALELSRQLFSVIELTEGVERIYLRDTLDKRSTTIPLLIARALSTGDMPRRRGLFENARIYATECEAILDVLGERGTLEAEVLASAITTTRELRDRLGALTIPPPRQI